jgi:hypothetical protein
MPSPINKSTLPICSTARARELGMDVSKVPTCAAHEGKKIAGCPVWDSCRFHRKEYGGFKGTRPHLLGVFLRDIEGGAKRDRCACFTFVSAYQPIMDFGLALRNEGKPNYPVVKIIAQEGDSIKVWTYPQVVDKNGNLKSLPRVAKDVTIEPFPDPTELDDNMEMERDIIEEYDDEVVAATTHTPKVGAPQAVKA